MYCIDARPSTKVDFYDDMISVKVYSGYNSFTTNTVISFDDTRYKQIYESFKEAFNKGYLNHYMFRRSEEVAVIPDIFIKLPIDFTKLSHAELVKTINSGYKYVPDTRPSFDSTLFDIHYTENQEFFHYDLENKKLIQRYGNCRLYQYGGKSCVSDTYEISDYGKIIENNRPFINEFLKEHNYTHLHSLMVSNVEYTKEFVVPLLAMKGSEAKEYKRNKYEETSY